MIKDKFLLNNLSLIDEIESNKNALIVVKKHLDFSKEILISYQHLMLALRQKNLFDLVGRYRLSVLKTKFKRLAILFFCCLSDLYHKGDHSTFSVRDLISSAELIKNEMKNNVFLLR